MERLLKGIEKYFIIFMMYSILGWIFEELYYLLMLHKIVNRGLLFGPYLPVYGIGIVIAYKLLWKFKNRKHRIWKIDFTPIWIFIAIFILSTIVEYISHYLLDTFFDIELWDYSKKFCNINGRVCLLTSSLFAVGGLFAFYYIQPKFERFYYKSKDKTKHLLCLILLIILFIDLICTLLFKQF